MSIDIPFMLGGQVFHTAAECSTQFGVPEAYVLHMIQSDVYPGCRRLTDSELLSYTSTLATLKSSETNS